MTAFGDFSPDDVEFIDEPINPVVFGLEITPTILGVLIALVGVGGAGYLFKEKVMPVAAGNATLRVDIATKEQQLISQAEELENIARIEAALAAAMQRRRNVYALFANEETMDTLLLDINQRIESSNAKLNGIRNQVRARGIPPILLEAQLQSFVPGEKVVVTDSSLGEGVNGKLIRETYAVSFSADYAQTQSILRNLERLEPLLMIRDFSITSTQAVEETVIGSDGQVISSPKSQLDTSFQIDALIPAADADIPPEVAPPETEEGAESESAESEAADP
ncbi:hypothetical protein S7335_2678 [Synechococcus sp. PCC 7335]|uniref:hypothetical protein n=1 Tax=Synechococcus sp. (strain ATCC 29403 / PCC 7335) TaxID=91464 RepID=UPI00017EC7B4|nr:hypothetical protein [Synechococcus sp. PCC 7335]EDX84979.1 hypothetical protein S7335_2678 [Synechococcus sp. PCC 7335]